MSFGANYTRNDSRNVNFTPDEYVTINMMPQCFADLSNADANQYYATIEDCHNLITDFELYLPEIEVIDLNSKNTCMLILDDVKQSYAKVKQLYPNIQLTKDIPNSKIRRKLTIFIKICKLLNLYTYKPNWQDCRYFHHYYFNPCEQESWYYRWWNGLKNLLRFN